MIEDLRNGITIVCDRYSYSGVAYSAAKVNTFGLGQLFLGIRL